MTDHLTRLSFTGYSILPPEGEGWDLVARDASNAIFGKRLNPKDHTLIATTILAPALLDFQSPEEFVDWVKSSRQQNTDPKRFHLLEHEEVVERYHEAYCSKYHLKAEDHDARGAGSQLAVLEMYGLSCMHPTAPSVIIDIGYSERYIPGSHTPVGQEEGERFIHGLEFLDLQQR